MPHFPHTPEALLGRNDSKNPASTCRAITSSGRACRRALATSRLPQTPEEAVATDLYCWQHKDQAKDVLPFPLRARSSIDTLVQKLGIDDGSRQEKAERKAKTKHPRPPERTATNDFAPKRPTSSAPHADKYASTPSKTRERLKKRSGFWASLCCMVGGDDEDYVEIVRHRKRVDQNQRVTTIQPNSRPQLTQIPAGHPLRNPDVSNCEPGLTSSQPQTNQLLSLIPPTLPTETISALLAELVKPISAHDEDGYIYIFWLTPQSKTRPPDSVTEAILPTNVGRPKNARRISDVMTEYSIDGGKDGPPEQRRKEIERKKTIMLKIGRANNITRRMNEWQRQCGYALNLVRWYPYVPSPSTPSPQPSPSHCRSQPLYPDLSQPLGSRRQSEGVRKCPHIHRIERLIHLELASKQVKRECSSCGKQHREWFEVEATQAGVKSVDETVRRWVAWAERQQVE